MASDLQLRQDVLDELKFEPSIDGAHIGAGINKGVVTISGSVGRYADSDKAELIHRD